MLNMSSESIYYVFNRLIDAGKVQVAVPRPDSPGHSHVHDVAAVCIRMLYDIINAVHNNGHLQSNMACMEVNTDA